MSSAGHVLDMIKRQKENRILQQQNRDRLKSKKTNSKISYKGKFNKEKFPIKSVFEINETKKKIHKEIINEKRAILVKSILAITLIIFVMFLIVSR